MATSPKAWKYATYVMFHSASTQNIYSLEHISKTCKTLNGNSVWDSANATVMLSSQRMMC